MSDWSDALGGVLSAEMADDPVDDDEDEDLDFDVAGEDELVHTVSARRDTNFLYYFEDGCVLRVPNDDEDATPEVVAKTAIVREPNFLYFVDTNLNVMRRPWRRKHGLPAEAPRVADVLSWLAVDAGRDGLVALCDLRGVPRRKSKDDMVVDLATSYAGDLRALVADIRQSDLVAMLASTDGIPLKETWWQVANASTLSDASLHGLAARAICELDTSELSPVADDEASPDQSGNSDEIRDALAAISDAPQPVAIRQLLVAAGLGTFTRLRTDRFNELRELTASVGFVLCDDDRKPFAVRAVSPGIDAKVFLLRRTTEEPIAAAFATVAIAEHVEPSPSASPAATPSSYEISVARLRILTAAQWPGRRSAEGWPGTFLDVACDPELDAAQRKILAMHAEKLADGGHNVDAAAVLLRRVLDRGHIAALVDAFEILNDGAVDVALARSSLQKLLGIS
jgi:hypothetical protein